MSMFIAYLCLTLTVAEQNQPMILRNLALPTVTLAGMAPHPGIDTDHIREKSRKDLLDLLEGVCKARQRILQTSGRC